MASVFVTTHRSVVDMSERMLMEMKRHNYVTPTNYLELVAGYKRQGLCMTCTYMYNIPLFVQPRFLLGIKYLFVTSIVFVFSLLDSKRQEIGNQANKLKSGLSKLIETREKVQAMSIELEEAKVQVADYQKQCDDYLVIIVQQKRDAEEQEKVNTQYIYLICIYLFVTVNYQCYMCLLIVFL